MSQREMYVLRTVWRAADDERDRDRRTGLTLTFPLGHETRDSISHLNAAALKG